MEKKVILLSFVILFGFATSICRAKYSGGDGSPANPYRISDANDMNDIGLHDEDWGSHFVMVNDVNLAQFTGTQFNIIGYYEGWGFPGGPIPGPGNEPNNEPFTGVFDGNYHTVYNFNYKSNNTKGIGLFGFIDDVNAEIRNLRLENSDVNSVNGYYVGSLVGSINAGTILNCIVEGGIVKGDDCIGGLAGQCSSYFCTISNCHASVSISGDGVIGGLVGRNAPWMIPGAAGTLLHCSVVGNVNGNGGTGGLIGLNCGLISNCYADVNVSSTGSSAGGLVGYNSFATISNCYATGDVNGNDYIGGLVGRDSLFGSGSLFSKCYATGNVSGHNCVGGLAGSNPGTISNCYATGDVNGNNYTGGLVGKTVIGSIEGCYATGAVDGNHYTGGLVGNTCITTIKNSYSAGSVSGHNYVGGLAGINLRLGSFVSQINNCYTITDVNGALSSNTGGLVGYDNGDVSYTSCFWDSDVNPDVNGIGNLTDPNVIGETTENMQTQSTFTDAGWDFVGETVNGSDDIWKMCYVPDYPHLWWEQCPKPSLEMPMHFTPRMLNPKSKGKWVKAHFVLPAGFAVGDVNTNSPARIIEPFTAESVYMDVFLNEDGLVEIMAAFDRADFCSNGSAQGNVVVIARLTTGQYFYGTDTIRIKTNNLEYLAVLTSYWLEAGCGEPDWCEGSDINQDGTVDFIDFAFFDGCCLEFIKN